MKNYLLLIFICSSFFANAQSPWVPGAGKQYHQLSFTTVPEYDELFLPDGISRRLERKVTDNTLQYFGEIGIGSKFSINLILPFKLLKAGDLSAANNPGPYSSSGNLNAIGDVQLAGKYQFFQKNGWVASGSFMMGLPTASTQEDTGLRTGFKALQLTPGIHAGIGKDKYYAYGYFQYNNFSKGFASSVYFGGEFGWIFPGDLILGIHLSNLVNVTNGDNFPSIENLATGMYLNRMEYYAFNLKLIKTFKASGWGGFASLGGGTGNLVAKSPAITVGVFKKI